MDAVLERNSFVCRGLSVESLLFNRQYCNSKPLCASCGQSLMVSDDVGHLSMCSLGICVAFVSASSNLLTIFNWLLLTHENSFYILSVSTFVLVCYY